MKKYVCYIVALVSLFASGELRADEILAGFPISATGNNKYECKLKANFLGMHQALSLSADKIGIKDASFDKIPYDVLSKVFSIDKIIRESAYEGLYEAVVNYRYTNLGLNQLLMRYGDKDVQKQLTNYVVIPIFKQKHTLYLVSQDSEWSYAWMDHAKYAYKHGLLPIDPKTQSSTIKVDNIMQYSYGDFLDHLPIKNFKNVLLVVCEYFTKDNGDTYFKLTTTEITPQNRNMSETLYDANDPKKARQYFDKAIKNVIRRFGGEKVEQDPISFTSEKPGRSHGDINSILNEPEPQVHLSKITMQLQVFDAKEIQEVKSKLDKIPDITKYHIALNDNKYLVDLYINSSLEALAKAFYLSDLSYSEYQGEYTMFPQGQEGI